MATVTASASELDGYRQNGTLYTWAAIPNGDQGSAVELTHGFVCVQITGTFGAGGTIVIQGSNDGSTWATLSDPQGNALSKTAAALEEVEEHPRYIRPSVTAGDGTTALTVTLLVRRSI